LGLNLVFEIAMMLTYCQTRSNAGKYLTMKIMTKVFKASELVLVRTYYVCMSI